MDNLKYKVIFTLGYQDDDESLLQHLRGDILIMDEDGSYYAPYFITLKRIEAEFRSRRNCYLEDNLVILHSVTKENILKSIPELHNWLFQKRWISLDKNKIEEFYYPIEKWEIFEVEVDTINK